MNDEVDFFRLRGFAGVGAHTVGHKCLMKYSAASFFLFFLPLHQIFSSGRPSLSQGDLTALSYSA